MSISTEIELVAWIMRRHIVAEIEPGPAHHLQIGVRVQGQQLQVKHLLLGGNEPVLVFPGGVGQGYRRRMHEGMVVALYPKQEFLLSRGRYLCAGGQPGDVLEPAEPDLVAHG